MRTLSIADPALLARAASHDAWQYYRAVTADNTGGAAKANWPVRIDLTSSNFTFAHANSDGSDIQVRASDGATVLPHWVEAWDSSGQTATVWVKVPAIGAGATATVRIYSSNAAASNTSSVSSVFLFAEDFRQAATAAVNLGAGNVGRASNPTLGNSGAYAANPIALHGGTGWRQSQVREQSNIVWTGTEWVFLVTGSNSSGTSQVGLYYATSLTGTWTEYSSNPVLPLAEDPYITVNSDGTIYADGSGWHYVTFERKQINSASSQLDVGVARTKDFRTDWEVWNGSAWTTSLSTHAVVLARGAASSWEQDFTGSPAVVMDGGTATMLYEGANGSNYQTGIARSTDHVTWTKEATNPVSTLDVPDDVRKLGSTWWMIGHGTSGNQYRYSTTVAPGSWNSSSWTADAAMFENGGNSVNLVFGPDGDRWATYQRSIGTTGMELFNWMGLGAKWDAERFNAGDGTKVAFTSIIEADDAGELVLKPLTSALSTQLAVWSVDAPLTYDFEVCFRRKVTVHSDDQYAYVAIGSGAVLSTFNIVTFANGYVVGVLNPAEATVGNQIRKYTSSAFVDVVNTTGISAALAQAFNRHEVRYSSAGVLDYRVAGTSVVSRTDTTHKAASKKLALWQGHNSSSRFGGVSHYEWVFARPWDGVDPSITVGSEVTT